MDTTSKKPVLHLVKDEACETAPQTGEAAIKPKSAFARQLTSFADDLDAQIALLLAQD
ncbi:MAG: hypothetical protein H7318_00390 [Oligoflexus sp.]|nr:hypothetical protein [Oligoflexus sp.]